MTRWQWEDDGLAIPDFLVATDETVRERWAGHVARPLATFVPAPETNALADEQAAQRKIKARNRIARMLAKKEDHSGMTWDTRVAKWVPINRPPSAASQGATVMGIEIAPKTYSRMIDAGRAARSYLGKPDAERGVDFEIEAVNGHGFTFKPIDAKEGATMKKPEKKAPTGRNAKVTKVAKGPTGIERQTVRIDDPALAEHPIAKKNAASWDHLLGRSRKRARLAAEAKAAGKPAKAPKPAKATKAAPKADKPASEAPNKGERKAREGTKTSTVRALLLQDGGTTTKDVLAATGWPSVSMPQQAEATGLTLRKEKVKGEPTRYYGTPAG